MEKELQQLKEKIWKANPSILELKFGCEIQFNSSGKKDFIAHTKTGYKEFPVSTVSFGSVRLKEIKSLGRPITLEDVLVVCKKQIIDGSEWIDVDIQGHIRRSWLERRGIGIMEWKRSDLGEWILNKPLHEQSEETIKFLNKLL